MNQSGPPRRNAVRPARANDEFEKSTEEDSSAIVETRDIHPARGSGDHIRTVRETFGSHDNNLGYLLGPGTRRGPFQVMNPDSPSDDEDGAVGLGAMVDSQESSGNVPVGRRYIQGALAALANGSTQPFSNSVAPLGPSRNMAMLASPGAPSQQRPFVGTPRPPYQAAQNSLSIRSARASSRQPPSPQGYPVQRYHPYAPPRQSQPIRAQPTLPRYTRYYAQLSPDQLAAEHQPVANASGSPQNDESLEALEEFHQLLAEKNERVRTWLRDIDPRNRFGK